MAAVLVCGLASISNIPARPDLRMRTVEERVLEALQEARQAAGNEMLDRRELLDGVAIERALRVSSKQHDQRLDEKTSIESDLNDAGIFQFKRAIARLILIRGQEPGKGVLARWLGHTQAWNTATSPEIDGIGLGTARSDDGWFVFVAVLVEDLLLPDDPGVMEWKVFEKVNAVRVAHTLQPLARLPELDDLARAHSLDMMQRSYFSHITPEGRTSANRLEDAGIGYKRIAENLTSNRGAEDPAGHAVDGWMDSPGHRANILDGRFTHTGLGAAVGADGTGYFTQLFLQR